MNGAEPSSSSTPAANASIADQLNSLRKLLITTLIFLIVFSGAVNLYLLRQVVTVRKELTRERSMIEAYTRNELPNIQTFISNLQNYSKTHPDINPILAKYNLLPSTNSMFAPTQK